VKFPGNTSKSNPIRQMRRAGTKIDLRELPDIICGNVIEGEPCDCQMFIKGAQIKKLSALHPANTDPQGADQTLNMEIWLCGKCGEALIIQGPDKNYKEREPESEPEENEIQ